MNIQKLKKYAFAVALALGFVVAPSLSSLSIVQAQDWRYRQDRRDDRWDSRDRRWDRRWGRRDGRWDRWDNRRDWRWDQRDYRWDNRGNWRWDRGDYGYGGYGYNGYGGYGYNSGDYQKGYRDGLDRGQRDARTNRIATPYNSAHFRSGNAAYREGFRQGYEVGYSQFSRYRGW